MKKMPGFMKAVMLTSIRQMEITDIPMPVIEKDSDVLLKIEMVGICGSDVHYYEQGRIGSQTVQYPYLVGHECAAIVEDVGRAVTTVKAGDKVAVEPAVYCHKCDQCKIGRENTCRNLQFLGTPGQGSGCLCQYIVIHEECCFPINGKLSSEQAVLSEPFAIGVYSAKQAQLSKNSSVAILGSGPIGLSCMVAAKAQGVENIYMTDILDYRMEIAKKSGAVWAGNPENDDG